jgi:glucose-1-phosphate adenylyltransferase
MDYGLFLDYHMERDADISISLLEVDRSLAHQFGVAVVDEDFRILGFQEKPKENVPTIPGDPDHVLASMGIYVFKTETLLGILKSGTDADFGKDIIPKSVERLRVYAYPYGAKNRIEDFVIEMLGDGERRVKLDPRTRDSAYWRDVGTLDSYWNANMDLTGVNPFFNLYGRRWPIHTYQVPAPPAKFIFAYERPEVLRVGKALDSIVAPGCIVSGIVRESVLSYNVLVRSWATVEESVILDEVVVGRHCRIKKAIVDKQNVIPPHTQIGVNPLEDRKRFTVTPRGIVVVPRGYFRG